MEYAASVTKNEADIPLFSNDEVQEGCKMKRFLVCILVLMMCLPNIVCMAEDIPIIMPLVNRLEEAEIVDAEIDGDVETVCVTYNPAKRDDLDLFRFLSASCGAFLYDLKLDNGMECFQIVVPGTAFEGFIILDEANEVLYIEVDGYADLLEEEEKDKILDFLYREVRLPAEASGNVFPQFYACAGRQPYYTGMVGELSFAFDGQMCWAEWYDEIDCTALNVYSRCMALFGFDVWMDTCLLTDNGEINPVVLHYSNEDAEVIVVYDALEKDARVYYEPGVSYYLLGTQELAEAIAD